MCSLTLNEIPKADFKSILRNNNLFVIKALNIHNIKKTYILLYMLLFFHLSIIFIWVRKIIM